MARKIITLEQLKKGEKIHAQTNRSGEEKEVITFDHTDGMYSYNTLPDGEVVHLSVGCSGPWKRGAFMTPRDVGSFGNFPVSSGFPFSFLKGSIQSISFFDVLPNTWQQDGLQFP